MGTRSDLLAAAAGLAENARSAAAPGEHTAPDFTLASEMAAAAKTALEAAALVSETPEPADIDAALVDAFVLLRGEMRALADQFANAGTATARRIADRIRTVLDEAEQLISPPSVAR